MKDHAITIDGLRAKYPGWEIIARPAGLPVVTAEHKSGGGRHIRFLVAHSAAELAVKLETAGTVEP